MTKDTNFKFGIHAPRESPDMTSEKFFEKGRGQGHVTPQILGVKMLIAPK